MSTTRHNRRRSAAVLAVVLTAGLAAACGGEDAEETAAQAAEVTDDQLEGVEITVADFFGDCIDAVAGNTDVSTATTECESMRILNNKFNEENPYGITVTREGGSEWGVYYDAVNAAFAANDAPDIMFMHAANLPDYAGRGLLLPLEEPVTEAGVDLGDLTEPALEGVTWDGEVYGVPQDLHANITHVNMDLMAEADLVDADGGPLMPTSPEELLEHAEQFEAATGQQYIAWANDFNIPFRVFWSLVAQQGETVVDEEGTATVDTEAGAKSLQLIADLYEQGVADPGQTYDSSQQAWLNGQVGMLVNGTWVVGEYSRSADFEYRVDDFPTLFGEPGVWANSHIWVVPTQEEEDPVRYRAAAEYAAWLFENNEAWALGTGHLSPRPSVLESDTYQAAPQRENYVDTATNASLVPQVPSWQGAEDVLAGSLETVWQSGAGVPDALREAQSQVEQRLD
jgi:multiple sugar transport system substrate-binding protein